MTVSSLLSWALCGAMMLTSVQATALDDYVWATDDHYGWVSACILPGYYYYVLYD